MAHLGSDRFRRCSLDLFGRLSNHAASVRLVEVVYMVVKRLLLCLVFLSQTVPRDKVYSSTVVLPAATSDRITPYYELVLDGRTKQEACGDRVYFGKSWRLIYDIFPTECKELNK